MGEAHRNMLWLNLVWLRGLVLLAVVMLLSVGAVGVLSGCSKAALPEKTVVATLVPPPAVPAAITRREPALVKVDLVTEERVGTMADGVEYKYWTFNGTVPGPMIRVRQGDTVEMTVKNSASSTMAHSIDLHAATGPGGGGAVTQVAPGQSKTFRFKALNPGVFIYHCATPLVPEHIANGMYGLIVVEPSEGMPKVDREFYVVQGDFYPEGKLGDKGQFGLSFEKLVAERPEYIVFNGAVGSLTGDKALRAKVGETVRIYFGVGGPNVTSSFHVIGEIFDRVHPEGSTEAMSNVQTTLVPAGGATWVEFKLEAPGTYILVDHSLSRLLRGAAGQLVVEGPEAPDVFHADTPAAETGRLQRRYESRQVGTTDPRH